MIVTSQPVELSRPAGVVIESLTELGSLLDVTLLGSLELLMRPLRLHPHDPINPPGRFDGNLDQTSLDRILWE